MQASSSVSTSTSAAHLQTIPSIPIANHAPVTIDPATLLGGTFTPPASTSAPTSAIVAGGSASNLIAVKQEPDDASSLSALQHVTTDGAGDILLNNQQRSISAAPFSNGKTQSRRGNESDSDEIDTIDVKTGTKHDAASMVDQLLQSDHKSILRPDLSPFVDARDALRRLLPYHIWNIPHHDLLKALDLKEDPVLSEVRSRKRRRIAHLDDCKIAAASNDGIAREAPHLTGASAEANMAPDKVLKDSDTVKMEPHESISELTPSNLRIDDDALNELGLPIPLPQVPQPAFPTLDFVDSVFARRHALASRFRRTLTALDTHHKRAPNTSLSLEHLERLAYNDDREDVLAQIEELKELKAKLEALEQSRQIDVAESSAKIKLRFGITDEIEREREKEREQERIKRQQERAAAKAAKLEKEREARHRLGIFTPPPEPPAPAISSVPAAPSPASTSTATSAPPILFAGGAPTAAAAGSLAMPSPYSAVSTPASTPGGFPFPLGTSLSYSTAFQPGSNGLPMPSPQFGHPSAYASMAGTPQLPFAAMSGVPPVGPNGVPMPSGVVPMGTPTSAPLMPAANSMPGTPSTPAAATPSKPPSKSKAKAPTAKAAASAATATGAPGTPGTPGTPGVTPGPTPHRGRGRPRKHPLPGTPGGPPIPVPRKKKDKPAKSPAATVSSAQSATAMSPPTLPPGAVAIGLQPRPPLSASPVPPTMPGPAPGYSGEAFVSMLPPTPTPVRPPAGSPPGNAASPMMVRPPTMHPTLTSATSLNTPRLTPPINASPSPASSTAAPAKTTPAKANGAMPKPATPPASAAATASTVAPAPAASSANPSIPNHPIPLLIPVASLPRLSALGIQPTPSPHIRPVIGPNGQPQGLQGLPIPIDPAQSVPAVLLGISEGTAETGADGTASTPGGKQQILHISVVLSRLSPSQLSGLAVLMQSLQAQVEAGKRK
ncbi:hypothetical protein EX895_002014 [Sporisorium graminicola]|uniref:GLTSCR protein conserved domain-containing protein n=1 Tax=Sporisorium graminicola TaxID=280036 RepID=A0A4U7KXR3_9BASI|nr:hypothetical protein EX895_002014 [Sporisorium graminicola]TKY89483.1 hypothetical protein EX895_002014 [Sporisorium graminicola]